MKLSNLWNEKSVTLSFEVFPPKKDTDFDTVRFAAEQIAELKPDFMSVTYGAGGGTSAYTAEIARILQAGHKVPALAHLTCVSSSRDRIHQELENLDRIPAEQGGDLYLINGSMLPLGSAGAYADINPTETEETNEDPSEEVLDMEKPGGRRPARRTGA